jgi:hypothetical protein
MKINLQILHLCAAIFNQDPLQLLVSWDFATKDKMEKTFQQLQCLKGVMPDPILTQVIEFLEGIYNNRGGSFQFIYTNKPGEIDAAITRWTEIISHDSSWLTIEPS